MKYSAHPWRSGRTALRRPTRLCHQPPSRDLKQIPESSWVSSLWFVVHRSWPQEIPRWSAQIHGWLPQQACKLPEICVWCVLYECVHAKSLQSCPTLRGPMDYRLPGSSVHRISQARILKCNAMPSLCVCVHLCNFLSKSTDSFHQVFSRKIASKKRLK